MIDNKIDQKLLQQAIKVLREHHMKHYEDSSKKKPLLEGEKETTLYLQFSLKKIPKCKSLKMIKMNLPHSLVKENTEICLITGDLDKRNHKADIEPDILHYKDLLKKHDINNISEVITLRQLRTEYKPYEAKQKLLAAYDVFLADRKIAECLPRLLGRHFFKKRKFPIQITLNTPNLKQQVDKALSTKVFYLTGHGNSCNSEVAYLDMSDAEIAENVKTMAGALCDKLSGSWDNVMGIYLKTALSKAIPLYISYDDPNKVHVEEEQEDNRWEIDELSTHPDKLVKVYKDGTVCAIRVKRLAEDGLNKTADINENSPNKKKKEDINEDILSSLADTDSNDKTADINSDYPNKEKKKKKIVDDIVSSSANRDSNDKIANILSGYPNEKKKKKKNIIDDFVSSSSNRDTNGVSANNKRKSKSKLKYEKNILEQVSDKSICSIEKKGESNAIGKKIKNNRKSLGTVLTGREDEGLISTKLKGILKKRKSLVNIV